MFHQQKNTTKNFHKLKTGISREKKLNTFLTNVKLVEGAEPMKLKCCGVQCTERMCIDVVNYFAGYGNYHGLLHRGQNGKNPTVYTRYFRNKEYLLL